MIYWFTGQPGSGKTTLADMLEKRLELHRSVYRIDGDTLRDSMENWDFSIRGGLKPSLQLKTTPILFTCTAMLLLLPWFLPIVCKGKSSSSWLDMKVSSSSMFTRGNGGSPRGFMPRDTNALCAALWILIRLTTPLKPL